MSAIRSIGILGAGVCGLAAAWRLLNRSQDLNITILESEDYPGGLARSLNFKGLRTDLGPHRIHTELAGILDFIKDIAGPDIVEVRRSSRMWLEGRWVDYPPRPLEMLRLLGPLRMAGYTGSYLWSRLALSGAASDDNESFQSLMEHAFGPKLYRFLVEPYTRKVWKTPPDQLHGDVARVRVSAGGLNRLIKQALGGGKQPQDAAALKSYHYIKGGIGRLSERMVEEIEKRGGKLHLKRTVVGLDRESEGKATSDTTGWHVAHVKTPREGATAQSAQQWRVAGHSPPEEDQRVDRFDALISTLPVTDLVSMLVPPSSESGEDADARRTAGDLRFLANILVFLVLRKPLDSPNQWLYFPHPDTIFNRGYVPANFDPGLGQPDQALLCLEVTCFPGDATWDLDDAQLAARVREDIAATGIVARDDIAESHVFRIPYTYPFYDLDYRRNTDRLWEFLKDMPRLLSAGRQGLFLHNNIDHSIYMGLNAAGVLFEHPDSPGPAWYSRIREFQGFRIVD